MTPHTVEALRALPKGNLVWVERTDGTRLRCLLSEPEGRSEPAQTVVLAHGILCSIPIWNLVLPELLRRGHRVISFDQRAHGQSTCGSEGTVAKAMAADLRAILEVFDVKNGILVGHSMGAYLGTVFCLDHPEVMRRRLDGMVLVGGHGGDVARTTPRTRLNTLFLKLGLAGLPFRSRSIARRLNRPIFGRRPDEAFYEAFRRIYLETDHRRLGGIVEDMIERDHYARLSTIELPTEVVCGDRDRVCPPWCSKELASITGARSTWLPGVGHMVIYEAPQAIVDAVTNLASTGAAGPRLVREDALVS
jgi:pimeloyl-ACP methyl ester carboxylesterase